MAQSWYTSPARAPVESIFDPPGVSERGDTVAAVAAAVGGLIAGVGLQDLIVVDTADALLICRSDRVQDVRKIADRLKASGRLDLI